jgi:alpha-tubulin suppressor-like RCC1 family protein
MSFEDELPLPKRVEMLYGNRIFAVGVAAGAKHTLVADADGAFWGFSHLNAIEAWNNPTVKAMRDGEDGSADDDFGLFGEQPTEDSGYSESERESICFRFLFSRGRASISMPVRIPVNVRGSI